MSNPDDHREVKPGRRLSIKDESNDSNVTTLPQRSGLAFVTEEDKEAQPLSKRQQRIAALGGLVGADGTAKGSVRTRDGNLEYLQEKVCKGEAASWKPAIYHDQIRAELIGMMDALGSYDHPRKRGLGPNDVTAFHPNHKTWGEERDARPEILFRIHPGTPAVPAQGNDLGKVVIKKPKGIPRGQVSLLVHNDRFVLDEDNHPIKFFPEIPLTCSSEMEGWEMEAIRRTNRAIGDKDIRARMPRSRVVLNKVNNVLEEHAQYSLSALGMRQSRFRHSKGLLSFESRAGSHNISSHIKNCLPQHCIDANSTKGFRDLTPQELHGLGSKNKGQYSYRKRPKPHDSNATGNNDQKTSVEALLPAEAHGKIERRQRKAIQTGTTEGRVKSDRTLRPVESDTAQDQTRVRVTRKRKGYESLDDDQPDSARPPRSKKLRQEQAVDVESAGYDREEIPAFDQSYTTAPVESQELYHPHEMDQQFPWFASNDNLESGGYDREEIPAFDRSYTTAPIGSHGPYHLHGTNQQFHLSASNYNLESGGYDREEIPAVDPSHTTAPVESQGPYNPHGMNQQFPSSASNDNQQPVSRSPANSADLPGEWSTPYGHGYAGYEFDLDHLLLDPTLYTNPFSH